MIADVSDGVIRGLVKAGAIEAVEVVDRRSLPAPRSRSSRRPRSSRRRPRPRATFVEAVRRRRLRALPARRRHRLGQDRSLFRGGRRGAAAGPADARPAARDRADRAVPQALRRALRLRAGRLAFGPAPVAAPPRLAGDRQRRGARWWSARARRCSCPIAKLGLIVVDEAHETELQAGGGRPVSRPRRRGDARPSSRTSRSSSPRRRRRSRRASMVEIGRYREAQAARPLRRRRAARHRARST